MRSNSYTVASPPRGLLAIALFASLGFFAVNTPASPSENPATHDQLPREEVAGLAVDGSLADPIVDRAKRGGPPRARPRPNIREGLFRLPAPRAVPVVYAGSKALTHALDVGLARPTALASGDFDEDGVADLIGGYASPDGDIVTLHRGNVDAIFPHMPAARQRRSGSTFTDEPFLSPAQSFESPVRPDFLAAGDFDNDGHWDVAAAAVGETSLYLLAGDGHGGFKAAERVALPGAVTAFVAGEINRRDGLTDLVVGVSGPDGPAVLVFEGPEGALRAAAEVLPVSAEPTALLLARLTDAPWRDLAVGTGEELLIVRGRDRRLVLDEPQRAEVAPPVAERIVMPAAIEALAWGDFAWEPVSTPELALLLGDGTIRMLGRAQTEAEGPDLWQTIGEREVLAPRTRATGSSYVRQLLPLRISGSPTQDLAILDAIDGRLDVLAGMVRGESEAHLAEPGVVVSVDMQEPPIAALGMRLNRDALTDVVLLQQDSGGPLVVENAPLATITVNSNADSTATDGTCTLREAINNSNSDSDTSGGDCVAGSGADAIEFNIGGGGSAATITPASALPGITDSVTIDGTTQGCASPPCILLDGSAAGAGVDGLALSGGSSTVRGLAIGGFTSNGILVESPGNILEGNFLGTLTGTTATANTNWGALLTSQDNLVGGTVAAARNVMSGNDTDGVAMQGAGAVQNEVLGNYIGTDVTGTVALGNFYDGAYIEDASDNTIGGTSAGSRNILSGNGYRGALISGASATGNQVLGNFIGTDVSGTIDLGNLHSGISNYNGANINTIGGTSVGARNIISGNDMNGVWLDQASQGCNVLGNFLGTDVSGTVALGNGVNYSAVSIAGANNTVGGTTVEARNIISGNPASGVYLNSFATQNFVVGNFIGTDVTGTADLGNAQRGVRIAGPANTIGGTSAGARNIISGNDTSGVELTSSATQNVVLGNFIGTDVAGTSALGNNERGVLIYGSDNTIGGTSAGARNIISGNLSLGVRFLGSGAQGNVVLGNFIGTDVSGTVALGNLLAGIQIGDSSNNNTIGGTLDGARNVISGNGNVQGYGVVIQSDLNEVIGNFIGTQVDGVSPLGNRYHGISVVDGASNNTIGGTGVTPGRCDGPCNRIGFTTDFGDDGVRINMGAGAGNAILGNSIFSSAELGIDLVASGVTANDPGDLDLGANEVQNHPVLTLVEATPSGTTVEGLLDSLPDSPFRIEFFANLACDSSGCGEGSRYIGFTNVVTDGTGIANFSAAIAGPVSDGEAITATATSQLNSTSEFSVCATAVCLSQANFGQTIGAPDRNSLDWTTPDDVRFVKGDLADVSSYLITDTGELPGATSLDTSSDSPAAGSGLYYLVRSLACGDWQTSLGTEPARDAALP